MSSLSSITDLSMVKGFADFLKSHNENDTSDEDASSNEADFVKIMVAGIAVMRQPPAVPPQLPSISTIMAVGRTTVAVALPSLKKKRKYKSGLLMWTNPITGIAHCLTPTMSHWYIYYIQHAPSQDQRFLCKFRLRFRVPYHYFQELSAELEERDEFRPWWTGATDGLGKPSTPITLLVLTALRYIGRAWTLDDLSENACIGEEVVRRFLHKFLRYASTVLYHRYVISPSTEEEARHHMAEYSDAGLPGAVGSTDATHILLERVPNKHRQTHLGFKSSHTSRAYNITVNHRRRILACTEGSPARWNDMTLATFDPFMQGLHEGSILQDVLFSLYAHNTDGQVVQHRYRGGWLLVDNGYLAHSTTVPPFKTTNSRAEIRFSTWLESLRKDVECTFGILKGRWRILKSGIRIHGTDGPDQVFLTCCALHNKLLDIDGLDERWEQGVQSIWSTTYDNDDGDNDDMMDSNTGTELDIPAIVPDAILRLQNPASERRYGVSDERLEFDHDRSQQSPAETATTVATTTDDDIVEVRKLSLSDFRRRLVVHFSIALERNEVQWPQRFVLNRN